MPLPEGVKRAWNHPDSGVRIEMGNKIKKSGVYRSKAGDAVYLREGATAPEQVLANYEYDDEATKTYVAEPEHGYFSSIVDAPQHPEVRKEPPLENRAEKGTAKGGEKTDAELAAEKA